MPTGEFSVDTTNETVTLQFLDDHNDVTPVPAGETVAFTSSDDTIATVAPDANDATGMTAQVTPVAAGQVTVTGTPAGTATDPSGNPFPAASVTLTIDPGAPVGDRVVSSN